MSAADARTITEAAAGAIVAQTVIATLRAADGKPEIAWLRFCELQAKYGKHSAALRTFVGELAKRARG